MHLLSFKRRHSTTTRIIKLLVGLSILISIVFTVIFFPQIVICPTTTNNNTTSAEPFVHCHDGDINTVDKEFSSFAPPIIVGHEEGLSTRDRDHTTTTKAVASNKHQRHVGKTNQPFRRTKRPRILFGIFSELNVPSERQRRHLIRNTYLAYDSVHNTSTPNRVCSLQEFLNTNAHDDTTTASEAMQKKIVQEECQLVYAFVLSGRNTTRRGTNTTLSLMKEPQNQFEEPNKSTSLYKYTVNPSQIDNHETDVIYLNVDEREKVGKLMTWFRYCATAMSLSDNFDFDYIVKTNTQVVILPTLFWKKNNIFHQVPPQQHVYGGIPESKSDCMSTNKCPSLKAGYLMRWFVLLSNDLVQELFSTATTTAIMQPRQLAPKETPDVVLANMLLQQDKKFQNVSITHGIVKKTSASGKVGDYLQVWDKYKDNFVSYQPDPNEVAYVTSHTTTRMPTATTMNNSHSPPPTNNRKPAAAILVLGIFSMDSTEESERRAMIRRTYLSQYSKSISNNKNSICSLSSFLVRNTSTTTPSRGHEGSINDFGCRLAYTFVMGGNPDGPTELVKYNDTYPLLLPQTNKGGVEEEQDTIYLNIRENMKEGKSQTWLTYASKYLLEEYGMYFDYIGKTDTDTLLYPSSFISQVLDQVPTFPDNTRIYGGDYRIRPSTDSLNLGPVYMGGHLYYLSPDLARFIISDNCKRSDVAVWSEDQSIGNFVHLHPLPIRRIRMTTNVFEHPVKKVTRFRSLWNKFVEKYKNKKFKTNN